MKSFKKSCRNFFYILPNMSFQFWKLDSSFKLIAQIKHLYINNLCFGICESWIFNLKGAKVWSLLMFMVESILYDIWKTVGKTVLFILARNSYKKATSPTFMVKSYFGRKHLSMFLMVMNKCMCRYIILLALLQQSQWPRVSKALACHSRDPRFETWGRGIFCSFF